MYLKKKKPLGHRRGAGMHPQRLGVRAPFPASSGTRAAHLAAAERQAARSTQPAAQTAEASAAARIFGERPLLRVPATSRCRTMPGTAAASAPGPGRPRWTARRRAKRRSRTPSSPAPAPSVAEQQPPAQSAGASQPAARRRSAGGQQRAGEAPEVPARPPGLVSLTV